MLELEGNDVVSRYGALVRRATDAEILEGLGWYEDAHAWVASLPATPAGTLFSAANAVAVVAACQSWVVTRRVVDWAAALGWVPPTTLSASQRRQWERAIKGLHPWSADAMKSTEFALAIASGGEFGVPIDRHMLAAAAGLRRPVSDEGYKRFSVGTHDACREAVEALAVKMGWGAGNCQAVVWVAWRSRYSRSAK